MRLELELRNSGGLHARPAAWLTHILSKHIGQVTSIAKLGREVERFSVADPGSTFLKLLLFAAPRGTRLSFEIAGPDTEAVTKDIREALERDFFSIDCKAKIQDCVEHYEMTNHLEIADALLAGCSSDLAWWAKLGHSGSLPGEIASTLRSQLKEVGEAQSVNFNPESLDEFRKIIFAFLE